MSRNKDFEAYVKRYADNYCNGNIEEAKKHAIVRSVQKYYEENQVVYGRAGCRTKERQRMYIL